MTEEEKLLAEAGKVLAKLQSQIGDDVQDVYLPEALHKLSADTITSLLARIAAQEAQMAEWQASQHYRYIGADGQPVLARDLEARAEAAETALAAERAKTAKLVEMLVGEREENLWNCYNVGRERDGRWSDCCMSDAEWLVLQCGLDPGQPDYDAAEVKAAIPVAARDAITEAGQ